MRFHHIPVAAGLSLVLMLLAGCSKPSSEPTGAQQDIPFTPEGVLDIYRADSSLIQRFVIELAETDAEQAQGLMYRRSIPERGGMLFVDEEESMQSFWMRNTPLPLDILFVRADGRIVNIVERTTPYSDENINSTAPAQYVLEVRAGTSKRLGIDSTAYISWQRRTFNTE